MSMLCTELENEQNSWVTELVFLIQGFEHAQRKQDESHCGHRTDQIHSMPTYILIKIYGSKVNYNV